jgi:hypothetical protein
MIKNTLFIISFIFTFSCPAFPSLDFMHKHTSAKKNAFRKVATGFFLIAPSYVALGDSPLASAISTTSWLSGLAISLTGLAQAAAEYSHNEEIKERNNIPAYDAAINKLCTDKRFLIGAALGTSGLFIHILTEGAQTSDAAKYAAILGLALMSEKIGEQLATDYWAHVVSLFNK